MPTPPDEPGTAADGPPPRPPTLHLTPVSVVRAVLVAAAVLAAFTVATRATGTLWWFVQAAVLAALAYPAVQRMSRRLPAFVAVLVLTAAVVAVVVGLVAVGLDELRTESQRFRDAVPGAVDRLERSEGLGTLIRDLGLENSIRQIADHAVERTRFDGPDLPGVATAVGGRISAVFVVWILTVMLVFTGPTMVNGLVGQTPEHARPQVALVLRQAYGRTVRYLSLTGLRAVGAGVVTFGVATWLGLDMPGMLAVAATLLAFVPYVGIMAAGLPVAVMALLYSPGQAAAVLLGAVAAQVIDALVVQRAIDGRSVQLGLFPTLVAAMIGYQLHGPGGLLIGVALATMVVAVVGDTGAVRSLREAAHRNDGPDEIGPDGIGPDGIEPALAE